VVLELLLENGVFHLKPHPFLLLGLYESDEVGELLVPLGYTLRRRPQLDRQGVEFSARPPLLIRVRPPQLGERVLVLSVSAFR
jgi:hypothetical protein